MTVSERREASSPPAASLLVRGDAQDVVHQAGHVPEDRVVDALENVTHRRAGLGDGDGVGVVDVAGAMRHGGDDFAVKGKRAAERDKSGEGRNGGGGHD